MGANSVPVNIWTGLIYRAWGWSEAVLRLPAVLSGLGSLLVLPVLVRRLWGERAAAIFGFLLAISPAAIFYSRLMRPYSEALFLGGTSLFCGLLWLREGGRGWAWAYVLCGVLALYYHPLAAAFAVFPPLIAGLGLRAAASPEDGPARGPTFKELLLACAALSALGVLFLGPANVSCPWWMGAEREDRATLASLARFAEILSGTASPLPEALFLLAMLGGLAALSAEGAEAAAVLGGSWALYLFYVIVSTREGIEAGIEIARYGIALFPAAFALAAVSVDRALGAVKRPAFRLLAGAAAASWLASLLATGPLRRGYLSGSNFAHHSAFQDDYAPIDWSSSRERDLSKSVIPGLVMKEADISPCYGRIRSAGAAGIVEYPVLAGDEYDAYYFPQHFHRLPVKAGWWSQDPPEQDPVARARGFVRDKARLDAVLAGARSRALRFRNLVDLSDPRALKRQRGWVALVHKNLLREQFPGVFGTWNLTDARSRAVDRRLRAALDAPLCETALVSAYRIR